MVAGRELTHSDAEPLWVGTEEIKSVKEFLYLSSVLASSGRVDADVERRIAQSSIAFGALS